MLFSTVLAAVFCWMYVTKPVFLSAPNDHQSIETQPAVQEANPEERVHGTLSPPTAGASGNLDPAVASLPGDSVLVAPQSLASESTVPGDELKPLVVRRDGPILFKPFVLNGDQSTSSESEKVEQVDPKPTANADAPADEIATATPAEPDHEQPEARSDETDYQVRASFMAEFSPAASNDKISKLRP